MELRLLQKSDSHPMLQVWNEAVLWDPLSPELLEEKVWSDPDFDPNLALVIEEKGKMAGWCMGVAREQKAGRIGYIKLVAIAMEYQSRGFGSAALDRLERQLFERGAREIRPFESNPNYLVPGLDPRYTKCMIMLEKRGYQRFSETYNLEALLHQTRFDTAKEETALLHDNIAIQQAEAKDKPAVEALLREQWAPWLHEVSQSYRYDPPRIHLAVDKTPGKQERVAGFAAYDGNNAGMGCFGPMGTHPDFRGKGIGGVLLKRCLRDIKAQGHEKAIIPWVGPMRFYAREVNALITRTFFRYRKEGLQS
ncbi:MAG: GNAT family N-acetyltransferase [Verrucomicrobiales bacterium]